MKRKINFPEAIRQIHPPLFKPMLATLVESLPTGNNWIYEIKFDGYRAMAFCDKNVNLISRNAKSFNEKFYPILEDLKKLKLRAVFDGEIVVLNEKGIANFEKLQDWRSEVDGELVYYVFDILWLNGFNLTNVPLVNRKQLLIDLFPPQSLIKYCNYFTKDPEKLLADAKINQLEGIIAKKSESLYQSGIRSKDWLKIKTHKRHEVVIGGFTQNENSPKLFSSLLVGLYKNNRLQYIGKIGTGFNKIVQNKMMQKFKPLISQKCPFTSVPDINQPSRFNPNPPKAKAIWLKPKLVCEVSYVEMSRDGIIRHPSFKGMREDKPAKDVHVEVAQKQVTKENLIIKINPSNKQLRKTLLNPTEKTQVKTINNKVIKFTNLNKIFWPNIDYTKRDLLNYYYQMSPYILPYLINRPQTLNRFPNGIEGKSFYQKDITHVAPSWIKHFPYHTSLGEDKNYLIVQNEEDIYWMVNLGVIEINPWSSTIQKIDYPTWCMIDLDPTQENTFDQVIKTALVTKKILDELNIEGFCKTSGASGLHIYIPLRAKYSYDQCQLLGRMLATEINKRLPKITSIERYAIKRTNKIYVDFLQNRPKATVAAPYSVRPTSFATVSMPLHWDEVKKGLKPTQFNLKNAIQRIKTEGDLFKPVLGKGINLKKVLKILNEKN